MSMSHIPVLVDEVVEIFKPVKNGIFVDATVGSGGHSSAILAENLKLKIKNLKIIGIDQDIDALTVASSKLKSKISKLGKDFVNNIILIHGNFRNLKSILKELKIDKVDGILADLGVSSMQLDSEDRGFSFRHDAPLDMRMGNNFQFSIFNFQIILNNQFSNILTAELIIKTWDERKIADILWQFGEERFARKIAKAIKENRKNINSTLDLARICEQCIPPRFRKRGIHPATKTFQALRIAVNDELGALEEFLEDAPGLLAPGGRMAIISFHSLEDRLVKQRFNQLIKSKDELKMMNYELLTKHPVVPTPEEIERNPRSRSAKLRVIERTLSA